MCQLTATERRRRRRRRRGWERGRRGAREERTKNDLIKFDGDHHYHARKKRARGKEEGEEEV